jgi:hypothetical protein
MAHYHNRVHVSRYEDDITTAAAGARPWNNHLAWPSQVNDHIWGPCKRFFQPLKYNLHQPAKSFVIKEKDKRMVQFYHNRRVPTQVVPDRELTWDHSGPLKAATLSTQIYKYRRHKDSTGEPLGVGRVLTQDPAYFLSPQPLSMKKSPERRAITERKNSRSRLISYDGSPHRREFLNTHRSTLPKPGGNFLRSPAKSPGKRKTRRQSAQSSTSDTVFLTQNEQEQKAGDISRSEQAVSEQPATE